MDWKMAVYTPGLELAGILEGFRSVNVTQRAFSAGSFTLECPAEERALALLKPDNLIWFGEDLAGVVECLEEQADSEGVYMTVQGHTLTGILDWRILWGRYDMTGSPEAIMRGLAADCAITPTRGETAARVIPGLVMTEEAVSPAPAIRKQKTGGTLLEALTELGEAETVAFGVRFDPAAPRMEFWTRKGVNRTREQSENLPVFFSTELDDVLSSEYFYNNGDRRDLALVAGEGEGAQRVYVTVGGEESVVSAAGFVPLGESGALITGDSLELAVRAVSEDGRYVSAYTGAQIDEAVGKVLSGQTGGGGGTAGVSSFKGRTGAVVPQTGDYTAEMVGAATLAQVNAAIQAAILDSWEGSY